jgi:hypothetical protein
MAAIELFAAQPEGGDRMVHNHRATLRPKLVSKGKGKGK